ncbi:MAG: leucine-rich repeat protein [Faecalibacterium prausnitzii]
MRTPRLRLLSALLAVALFFTLLPVSALAEGGGSTGVSHVATRSLNTDNKDDQGLTYTLNAADHTATVANYDNSTPDGVIDIPDTVTSGGQTYTVTAIGEYAFIPSRKITNVSSVFIPATVTSIGRFAFRCCKFLATVTFAEGSQLKSIGVSAFSGTNPAHPRFKEIQIPNSVETIGTNAFQNCQDLESITLPASLKTIESSAFSYCLNLSEIRLPTSLKAIQSYVFDGCSSLETVFYDGSLAQWSRINTSNGFLGYSSPSLVMGDYTAQFIPVKDENDPDPPPKTVTITKYTGTESTVILPSTINSWPVTKIGEDAFQDNTTITSVTIPANVTEIGSNAFAGCTNLTSVNYGGDWSNLTIQSGNPAVEDAAKDAANEQLFDFEFTPDNTAVIVNNYKCKGTAADVTIPSRYKGKPVTAINNAAFPNSAVTSVTIPDSITSIPDAAFVNCSKLTNISIPNSVTYIGFSAFSSCTSLKSITLPSSLSTIGNSAFAGCPSSMTVTYPGSKTQWDDDITKGSNNDVLENHLICNKLEATFTADGTTFAQPQTIDRGGKFTEPAAPSKENHTFAGWYNGDEKFDFDADTTNAPNVLNLVAKWDINQYTVKFVSDHGSFADQTIEHGKPIDTGKLIIPTVEGFTFDGWYADENRTIEFDFTKPIKSNTTVYAKWTANDYEVSFITEHSDAPASQNVKYNGTAKDPGKLSAEGYTFIGWYTDATYSTKFDFNTPITGDTKVYAKWEKNAPVLPDTYALNVSGAFVYVDGVDVTASAGDTTLQLEKDASVRLVADPDRMPSGMVFDRWTILNGALNADDAEKFETGRTLEEFAFTMPAEPLSIEATPRMQEEEGSDTVSVIAGVTLGTAATALVAWQAYDLGMSLYQEHWLPADFVMPKTRAELALLLWNTAGRPAPAAQPAFADITDPDTAQAAQWAVETGLMTPKSADLFKPEKSVTRWKAVRSWKRVTNQNT